MDAHRVPLAVAFARSVNPYMTGYNCLYSHKLVEQGEPYAEGRGRRFGTVRTIRRRAGRTDGGGGAYTAVSGRCRTIADAARGLDRAEAARRGDRHHRARPDARHELITGAVLALAVAGWAVALRACCSARLAVNTDHIRRWLQAIVGLAGATIRTGGALLAVIAKRASPRTDVSSFVHGPADEPGANGRRATAVLAASLAPDSFVVRTPADENRVLIHRLAPAQRTPDPLWLA